MLLLTSSHFCAWRKLHHFALAPDLNTPKSAAFPLEDLRSDPIFLIEENSNRAEPPLNSSHPLFLPLNTYACNMEKLT